jgi:Ni,Fe-hydrogenase III small subunit/formate hydrogenlyase subunit 6/NADH:ubiquinone oxidoreductase subunit I
MFKALLARARQGYRTAGYPDQAPALPPLFLGRPVLNAANCASGCTRCIDICPTDALLMSTSGPELDLGRCIFCGECAAACPEDAIEFTRDWRLAASARGDLAVTDDRELRVEVLREELRRLLGRSLRLRQISAGGCNGCEAEINALGNVVFDASRFGIDFVASPRHADGVLITGPVTENMKEATLQTYQAVAEPKLVIAAGACAISGGIFRDHAEVRNVAEGLLPVDLYIPGCPPHPYTIIDGLLRLLGRL